MNNVFGKHLRELRKEKGLNIDQLSKQIGYSKSIISYWETGQREPTLSAVIAIIKFFEVPLDYLTDLDVDFGVRVADAPTAAGELSAEELQIIADYRSLSPGLKDMIKRTLDIYTNKTNADA